MRCGRDGPIDNARMPDSRRVAFFLEARAAIDGGGFVSLLLSANRARGAALRSVRARRIELRGQAGLSLTYRETTRDTVRNVTPIDDGLAALVALLEPAADPSFAHATLQLTTGTVEMRISKKGQATVHRQAQPQAADEAAPAATHDRQRRRHLALELPIWRALGIADEVGRLVPSMAGKWRQIDKFVEILEAAVASTPALLEMASARPLRVVDFGCGKGYLTFAVHAFLAERTGGQVEVCGVELRPELVELGNAAAVRAGLSGIAFVVGDLRSVAPPPADIVIALHACDTATDHALALGVSAGASILVCSPCCHRELRPQMHAPGPLGAVLRHGIHRGQEAEMVTDSLRALLLESCGYRAQVFEFVALEHTRKNKMILATRRPSDPAHATAALQQVGDVKAFYGIREQCLEVLLLGRAPVASGSRTSGP